MRIGARGGHAQRAGLDRFCHEGAHSRQIVRRRRLEVRAALAHDIDAQRAVRQLCGEIDIAVALFESIEIVGKGFPVERYAGSHHHLGDILDPFHQLDHQLPVLGPGRGKADAAVAHDDRRDAVIGGGGKPVFPGDLTVVMRVHIDEAGGDDSPAGVQFLARGPAEVSDCGNHTALDADVAFERLAPGSIVDPATANDQVEIGHILLSSPDPRWHLIVGQPVAAAKRWFGRPQQFRNAMV